MTCCEEVTDVRIRFLAKILPFCWFSTICCSFSSCHMARRVVIDFVWYWGIIEKIYELVLTLPIHTPQGRDWIPQTRVNQGWLVINGSCVQLNDTEQIQAVPVILHKLSHHFVTFHGSNEHSRFFHHIMVLRAFWLTLSDIQETDYGFADSIIISWFWFLDGRTRLDFLKLLGVINAKWGIKSILDGKLVSIRDYMSWFGQRC